MQQPHIVSLRLNLMLFAVLMLLLLATVGASYLPIGRLHLPLAMTIASVKAALILTYFMHLRYSTHLVRVFASAAFVWLAILILLTLNDYASRDELAILGK